MTIERAEYESEFGDKPSGEKPTYEAWLADHEQTTVIEAADVIITGYEPDGGAPEVEYSAENWYVTVKGTKYRYERWFSRNSGGVEWYAENGERDDEVGDFIVLGQQLPVYHVVNNSRVLADNEYREATLDDVFQEWAEEAAGSYQARVDELVKPMLDQIKQEVFPYSVV